MKPLLLTTIAAVVLVGCGESQSPEPTTAKAPDISIHKAADEGNIEAVKQHIAAGTDVNVKSDDGATPLVYAAYYGRKEVAELLIAEGANVNAKIPRNGSTPLHHAAEAGHKEIVQLLIAKGADVNAKDEFDGWTALHVAAYHQNKEVAELLIAKGADVNAFSKIVWTPLDVAVERKHPEITDLLLKHGGKKGKELEDAPEPPTVKAPDIDIHFAAAMGNIEDVKQHLAAGTDVNTTVGWTETPLDLAIRSKYPEIADLLRKHGGKTAEELKAEGK